MTTHGITIKNVILGIKYTQQLVTSVIARLSVLKQSAVARRAEKANKIYKISNIRVGTVKTSYKPFTINILNGVPY
jgi:hypothetical protein